MAIAPPSFLGCISIHFPRVLNKPPPVVQTYRPAYRRAQAALSAKNAPFQYSFSLALVFRALADDNAERLFTLAAAFPAKPVILPPPVLAIKKLHSRRAFLDNRGICYQPSVSSADAKVSAEYSGSVSAASLRLALSAIVIMSSSYSSGNAAAIRASVAAACPLCKWR